MAGEHILIVDDDPDTLTLLALTLRRAGFRVSRAQSGQEAVALVKSQTFDLVLLDLMMPGMSGLDALRAIRVARDRMPRVLVLTAKSAFADQVTARQLGAVGYLLKPVTRDELLRRIRAALDNPPPEKRIP